LHKNWKLITRTTLVHECPHLLLHREKIVPSLLQLLWANHCILVPRLLEGLFRTENVIVLEKLVTIALASN